MKWRTEVEIPKSAFPIGYPDEILVLGSCFADNLSGKLAYYQFRHLANPFGVLFHPTPIARLIERATKEKHFTVEDLFEHQQLWRSLEVHSRLATTSRDETLAQMNRALISLEKTLKRASHIVLTLGTAFAFRNLKEDILAANCHKLPQELFRRELTPVAELIYTLQGTVATIRQNNPKCQILLTVSPVRHLRDGLVENQRSKAHLLAAVHQVVNSEDTHYFPAYELLMDELRDYRFYNSDLIHPTQQAVDFVWEKFMDAWVAPEAVPVMKRVSAIRRQLAHREFASDTEPGVASKESLKQKIQGLMADYPFIHFEL
jgi:hypothetical protein